MIDILPRKLYYIPSHIFSSLFLTRGGLRREEKFGRCVVSPPPLPLFITEKAKEKRYLFVDITTYFLPSLTPQVASPENPSVSDVRNDQSLLSLQVALPQYPVHIRPLPDVRSIFNSLTTWYCTYPGLPGGS